MALHNLGMGDYELQQRSRRIFDELYADRFAQHVNFLGLRRGTVYLRVRDGSWVRRVRAYEAQILRDLTTLGEWPDGAPKKLAIKVGPAPDLT